MYYLSIGSVIKDEQRYLKEWLLYHLLVGVQHFYILDNSTHNECYKALRYYIDKGFVTYEKFKEKDTPQRTGFTKLINQTKKETYWLALIDPDEFIFLTKHAYLPEFLENYSGRNAYEVGALAIHWICFGSSGRYYTHPYTLNLYKRSAEGYLVNKKIKCIVRPEVTLQAAGSHYFHYDTGYVAVNEKFEYMPTGLNGPKTWKPSSHTSNLIRINHYPIRSLQNLKEKRKFRGFVDKPIELQTNNFWHRYKFEYDGPQCNAIYDDSMKPYYNKLLCVLSPNYTKSI